MLKKNIDREKRKLRPNQWRGFSDSYGLTKKQAVDKYNKHEFIKLKKELY